MQGLLSASAGKQQGLQCNAPPTELPEPGVTKARTSGLREVCRHPGWPEFAVPLI